MKTLALFSGSLAFSLDRISLHVILIDSDLVMFKMKVFTKYSTSLLAILFNLSTYSLTFSWAAWTFVTQSIGLICISLEFKSIYSSAHTNTPLAGLFVVNWPFSLSSVAHIVHKYQTLFSFSYLLTLDLS